MTSSPERDRAIEPLPPALRSMWRLCKLGYRHEPRMMVASFVLSQIAALPDALLALWLMLLGKGVIEHRSGMVQGAAIGLGVSAAATWVLRTLSTRVQRRFRDRVTIALESHVAQLLASIHPALILLVVFAAPTVLTSTWRPAVERAAQERGAQASRLSRHLFTMVTTASPGKEVRVIGIGEQLATMRRAAWERWYVPVAAARW